MMQSIGIKKVKNNKQKDERWILILIYKILGQKN